mmetsp:Transcript_8455/g.14827  ORF Transcript_8455/g.14827 Transcript_8455/m.14827 type:complete len:247 (+) Transcript_8455:139-879(+)
MPLPLQIMPLPGRPTNAIPPAPRSGSSSSVASSKKKSNPMLENASAEELSVLVLTIQDEYAKLSKEKAFADDTISDLNQQYKDAMDEICSLNTNLKDLATENDEVKSMMDTQSVSFEKCAAEVDSIASMKENSDHALAESEAQTTAMREALVGEISRLTAEMSKYANEVEELQEEKEEVEGENKKLHEDLTLARRDAERARLEGTMSPRRPQKHCRTRDHGWHPSWKKCNTNSTSSAMSSIIKSPK